MKCQRCLTNEVQYRAITDVMDMKICPFCAEEAQKLGIRVETFVPDTGAFSRLQKLNSEGRTLVGTENGQLQKL